jgi:hypothetical protein
MNSCTFVSKKPRFSFPFRSDAMKFDRAEEQVAEQYRAEGYTVTIRPRGGELPPLALGLSADLLATKEGEKVLVQVRENRADLRDDPESMRLADAVQQSPGWRLDLVVLNRDSAAEPFAREAPEPSAEMILHNLDHAERSAKAGDQISAFVIAWGALEACMRRSARSVGVELANLSPRYLLRDLFSNGLLDRATFDRLAGHLRLRNALVHGLGTPKIDAAPVLEVVAAARTILEAMQPEAAVP